MFEYYVLAGALALALVVALVSQRRNGRFSRKPTVAQGPVFDVEAAGPEALAGSEGSAASAPSAGSAGSGRLLFSSRRPFALRAEPPGSCWVRSLIWFRG